MDVEGLELLGAVITLDGANLLERMSRGSIAGEGSSVLWAASSAATQAAVPAANSRLDLMIGRVGGNVDRKYVAELLYLRVSVDAAAELNGKTDTSAGGGTMGTALVNTQSGGDNELAAFQINSGTGATLAAPIWLRAQMYPGAGGFYEYNGLWAGIPLATLYSDVVTDDFMQIRAVGSVVNTALTAFFQAIFKVYPVNA